MKRKYNPPPSPLSVCRVCENKLLKTLSYDCRGDRHYCVCKNFFLCEHHYKSIWRFFHCKYCNRSICYICGYNEYEPRNSICFDCEYMLKRRKKEIKKY